MEPADTLQSATGGPEHIPRHSHFSDLEHQPPGVANQPCPDLDELQPVTSTTALQHVAGPSTVQTVVAMVFPVQTTWLPCPYPFRKGIQD